jgi:MerC mercury resistance protein
MSGGPAPSMPARADWLGVALSLGCAAHCVGGPLLTAVLPTVGVWWLVGGRAEVLLVATALVLAAGSLCWGVRVHGRRGVFLPLAAALALIMTGRLLAVAPYEHLLVVTGAVCLTAGHLLNRHLCRTCAACPDEGWEGSVGSRESTG